MESESRFIRLPEVRKRVGLATTTIYKYMKLGTFPKQIKLGHTMSAWLESDIDVWIAEQVRKSRDDTTSID